MTDKLQMKDEENSRLLQELKEKGALTDAEFDAAKAKVLSES